MPKCLFERATGRFVAGTMYDDIPHIAETHVQVTLADWPDKERSRWDGADGVMELSVAEELLIVKPAALVAIDAAAGDARRRYITDIPGQDGTYLLKAADADAYVAAGYPAEDIDNYPWVKAKAQSSVATPSADDYGTAADLIRATRNAWIQLGTAIERERERGKAAVQAAENPAAVESAKNSAVSALGAI